MKRCLFKCGFSGATQGIVDIHTKLMHKGKLNDFKMKCECKGGEILYIGDFDDGQIYVSIDRNPKTKKKLLTLIKKHEREVKRATTEGTLREVIYAIKYGTLTTYLDRMFTYYNLDRKAKHKEVEK